VPARAGRRRGRGWGEALGAGNGSNERSEDAPLQARPVGLDWSNRG
jgi:hypothetical protein